jgi:hypothetical protein
MRAAELLAELLAIRREYPHAATTVGLADTCKALHENPKIIALASRIERDPLSLIADLDRPLAAAIHPASEGDPQAGLLDSMSLEEVLDTVCPPERQRTAPTVAEKPVAPKRPLPSKWRHALAAAVTRGVARE